MHFKHYSDTTKRKERELIPLSIVHRLQHSSSISHLEFSGEMATPTPSPSTANRGAGASGSGGSSREGTAKAAVADQISQAVQSTSNLLHLMQQSSPSQAHLTRLPKSLLAKTATIKNTAQVLEHMPWVISSLDAYMENSLQSLPHLNTVMQLLSNIESSRLNSTSRVPQPHKEQDQTGEEHER